MHNQRYHAGVKVSSVAWQVLGVAFGLICGVTINTGPEDPRTGDPRTRGPEDRGPKDQGPNNLAQLHLAFMTEMQLVSMF